MSALSDFYSSVSNPGIGNSNLETAYNRLGLEDKKTAREWVKKNRPDLLSVLDKASMAQGAFMTGDF